MEKKRWADKKPARILCEQADQGTCIVKYYKTDNREEYGTEERNWSSFKTGE